MWFNFQNATLKIWRIETDISYMRKDINPPKKKKDLSIEQRNYGQELMSICP